MPDEHLEDLLPNRPRSWRVLMHHIYQIPVAFLEMEELGRTLTYEALTEPPPAVMRTSAAIADHRRGGAGTLQRVVESGPPAKISRAGCPRISAAPPGTRCWNAPSGTPRSMSVRLHRCWRRLRWRRDRPLAADDLRGLPLTDKVWDES